MNGNINVKYTCFDLNKSSLLSSYFLNISPNQFLREQFKMLKSPVTISLLYSQKLSLNI